MSENSYFCQLCSSTSAYYSFDALYTHINLVHGNDRSFKLRCELTPLCGSIYTTFASYKCHIYRHHRDLISKSLDKVNELSCPDGSLNNDYAFCYADDDGLEPQTINNQKDYSFELMNEYDEETELDHPLFTETNLKHDEEPFYMKKFQKYYTRFLLELREQHLLSQNIISSITSNISVLFNIVLNIIKRTGNDANTTATAVIPIVKVEETINQTIRMIENTASNEYKFLKSCKEFFKYEEPYELEFDKSGKCGYIIPIKKSIQNFLNKPEVIDLLIKNTNETILASKNDKDLLLTYRDGTAAAANKSLQKDRTSFLLQLYSDEVSVTNPIGPKKDEQKLSLFYYILDDLPQIIRSLLNSIGLIGICLSKFLTNPSHRHKFFETMVNDLNELQTKGLTLSCFTGRLYFAFDLMAADNLAANDFGGFQKNFNNGYFCRMCYISYTYKSVPLTDISFLFRSKTSHEYYLNQMLQSKNSIFGITRRCDFSNLIAFHPVKSLPFDIMHDFSEGVCMIIVNSILKELSARRILTYTQIESRLEGFKYGQNDQSNKPPTVRPKHLTNNHISGSASQKLLLFQMIPIIFNDVIDRLTDLLPIYICLLDDGDNEGQLLFIDENIKTCDSIPFVEEVVIENAEASLSKSSSSTHSEDEEHDDRLIENEIQLQEDYELPQFPTDLKLVVDQKNFTKLAAHTYFRRVLLNLVYDDIAHKHNLLYPKAQDYLIITKAVLRSLNIPIDDKNALNEYRESIKQKFKNERKPLQKINAQVQRNKNKFGKGPGRPVKKTDLVSAERKTEKIIFIGRSDDEQDMFKLNQMMKDEFNKQSPDMEVITYYWRKTFTYRRLFTRNNSTKDVLLEYPSYSLPSLIFEEVRMTTDIDVEHNVELFLPALFEKVPDNSMFISDVLPIRLIKLLYKNFKDPVLHVLTEKDPTEPTPCIKMCDNKYELYLDYQLIGQTTSAQQAVSFLLCLYNIFEIKFTRHSRGIHLLYGVVFQDQNELKNKSIAHQHQMTTTTMNNISVIQNTTSVKRNENDSMVIEESEFIQDQQTNNVTRETTLTSSFNNTQRLNLLFSNSSSMFVTYFALPFTLAAKKNINVVSTTSEHEFISTGKQCTNLNVDENIFQTIHTNCFDTEPTPGSPQQSKKKRKPPAIHEETTRIPPRRQRKRSKLT
ncbi:unnamed protein product [Rotaria sordida]|uniref:C2H2-type domain-containing protein n=1 Tax=Rotaria sordida TaxID=392033 RepID=A0A818H4R4_9BILA|nr:unnamed protein product [Rotaria sordida]